MSTRTAAPVTDVYNTSRSHSRETHLACGKFIQPPHPTRAVPAGLKEQASQNRDAVILDRLTASAAARGSESPGPTGNGKS